jgi:hypothetical protein
MSYNSYRLAIIDMESYSNHALCITYVTRTHEHVHTRYNNSTSSHDMEPNSHMN